MNLTVRRTKKGSWWIRGLGYPCGPYGNKAAAEADKRGMIRGFTQYGFPIGETKMQVTRNRLVELFKALGYATAEQWNPERMRKNIAKLGDKDEDAVLDKLKEDKALSKEDRDALGELALELMAATTAKEEVEVLATADDGDTVEVETAAAETQDNKVEEVVEKATAKPKREKKEKKAATAKVAKPKKAPVEASENGDGKKLSLIKAAVKVLEEEDKPMKPKEIVEAVLAKGYWEQGEGKTPVSTLAASIMIEIKKKGDESRFVKTAPGTFALS